MDLRSPIGRSQPLVYRIRTVYRIIIHLNRCGWYGGLGGWGRFGGVGVLYGYQTRDLSSVSIVVSLEERVISGAPIRSLVWEKIVWSGKNEFGQGKTSLVWEKRVSCAQNLCFAFRMLRGPN